MQKSHLTVGLLAAVALVVGFAVMQSGGLSGQSASVAGLPEKPVLITYSETGFVPAVVKVKRGTSLRILNTGGNALRIAPVIDPAFNTEAYKGFEGSQSVKLGDSFEISVTEPGVWGYKNMNNPTAVGVVVVE